MNLKFFTSLILSHLAPIAVVLAAPTVHLRPVQLYDGASTGKVIVKFKDGVDRAEWYTKLGIDRRRLHSGGDDDDVAGADGFDDWDLVNGFAGNLDTNALNSLRASDDVEYIAEDGIMHAMATQTNAPWGLQRISQDPRLSSASTGALNYRYTFDDSAGQGVDIYIVDTGINTAHADFGGRARWGRSFDNLPNADRHGHGTHCAGTAAGNRFGVAKRANIIAVKVLSDSGSGSTSGIVSGLNWVRQQVAASRRPSVVSMSLGGSISTALDNAVAALTSAGIHVVVAAGNENQNAQNVSPARAPSAITVGATTITDARSSFSNFGSIVDIFAPGSAIISTWIGSTTATNSISGTSMATPHVAGIVAYLIAKDGNISPAAMSTKLKNLAVRNAISGLPSGTPNLLANIS